MSTYSLSGSGSQALSTGTTALRVTITTLPAGLTSGRANPTNHFDIGMLRFSDGIAYWSPIPIVGGPQWIGLPTGTVSFAYALLNGAHVDVTEVIGGISPFGPRAFRGARAFKSTSQSIANNTIVPITLDSERYDTDNFHSVSVNTSRMTIPTGFGGNYSIQGNVEFAVNATGIRDAYIRLNGSTLIGVARGWPGTSNGGGIVIVSTDWQLAAADFVELCVFQQSGGALNVNSSSSYSPELMLKANA